jgi:hypothetical protein
VKAHEWRAGSVAGEPGHSLGVHLIGQKAGVWADFAVGTSGDALDLVRHCLGLEMADAISWSQCWLGIERGNAGISSRPGPPPPASPPPSSSSPSSDRWRRPWRASPPFSGTVAGVYLHARGLCFEDPCGEVLRFARCHPRRGPDGALEHNPALLALLRDLRTGEPCGTINIYLRADGNDRLRDRKGKTSWGRARGAAVMFSDFADVTMGLTVCEGVETGLALLADDMAPVWSLGGAENLARFPVLGGIEAATIAADTGQPGQDAAVMMAARWRSAGRETLIVTPRKHGDWADPRRAMSP